MFRSANEFLILPTMNPELPHQVESLLTQAGLQVMRTFQYPAAAESTLDLLNPACIVSQLVILLVYGKSESPLTLTIQIDQRLAVFSLTKQIHAPTNRYLETKIIQTLLRPQNGLALVDELPLETKPNNQGAIDA